MRVKIKKCAPKMEQGGKLVPVEVEKQETASLPNGKEVEFNGPSHENGGVETLLPINSKVKSDFLKPSSLLKKKEELEELSEMLGVKVSKKDTYASIDKRINDKFQIIKNQKILESGNYDKLFKDTAKTQIDQAQPVKEMLFNLQQMHNGNSSGEYKSKDGGTIMPNGGKVDIEDLKNRIAYSEQKIREYKTDLQNHPSYRSVYLKWIKESQDNIDYLQKQIDWKPAQEFSPQNILKSAYIKDYTPPKTEESPDKILSSKKIDTIHKIQQKQEELDNYVKNNNYGSKTEQIKKAKQELLDLKQNLNILYEKGVVSPENVNDVSDIKTSSLSYLKDYIKNPYESALWNTQTKIENDFKSAPNSQIQQPVTSPQPQNKTPQSQQVQQNNTSYDGINPYYGKDNPSSLTKEQWNAVAQKVGFVYNPKDPASKEKQFQDKLLSIPEYKAILEKSHSSQGKGMPINGIVDGFIGARWDDVGKAVLTGGKAPLSTIERPIKGGELPKAPTKIGDTGITNNTTTNMTDSDKYNLSAEEVENPIYKKTPFDFTQILPEGLAYLKDPGISTWTKKFSPILNKPAELNIQDNLNKNQADFNAINKDLVNDSTKQSTVAQLAANKYAANNAIYNQKWNFDNQQRVQTDNQNNATLNTAENINFQRAKTQFDERDLAKEHEYARKMDIFGSISDKVAKYNRDEATKQFWHGILSKNYTTDANGNLVFDDSTGTNVLGDIVPLNKSSKNVVKQTQTVTEKTPTGGKRSTTTTTR